MSGSAHAGRQLAIFGEMLPWILRAARTEPRFPALLQKRLAGDRRFGSRDRRIYRELAYAAVRFLPRIEAAPPADRAALALACAPDTKELRPLRGDAGTSGTPADAGAAELFPAWLAAECPPLAAPAARAVLNTRPPLWLRAQRISAAALELFVADAGLPGRASSVLPGAVGVLSETDLTRTDEFQRGDFEIQDLGSQLILALAAPAAGERWLDACAGAGGKTLQLAQVLGSDGHVDATDIRPEALEELAERADRARLRNIRIARPAADARFDGVLVDAPCSGSGTWRRAPHLKWQTSAADLAAQAERQLRILTAQAAHVRPGGRLVYATCSLARTENDGVTGRFLAAQPEFSPEFPAENRGAERGEFGLTILPRTHDTDAYYVSILRRR